MTYITMKRFISVFSIFVLLNISLHASVENEDFFRSWKGDKYSMFIHFGLYSHLGGVWDGSPVTQGYSEQIQSFAGIFGDWYASVANEFRPDKFDAVEIVNLAKAAGMRSIVFTSKHHDGFCMFDTETTEYNSVDRTPDSRDYVAELSEACAAAGMKFGLYFSLIDWNFPHAYPISSHNADFVTPQHHELSKAQVTELLTNYGTISELWFDMGSLQPAQSKELYELVKSLQPHCMVSGRLGNDVYDFAVMADNKLPEVRLDAPWQSAASMFPETWSYRSWQERGTVEDKVAEKLRSLIDVVSRGGNYLLNIGPAADGSVVPFERDVLLSIGKWLDVNGEAVYGASASPYVESFDWGTVTVKEQMMYLLLTGTCPEDGMIRFNVRPGNMLREYNRTRHARVNTGNGDCMVEVDEHMYSKADDVWVITLEFDKVLDEVVKADLQKKQMLSWENAHPSYSYSCFDYYSNYRSTIAYNWYLSGVSKVKTIEILYTESEVGRTIDLEVNGQPMKVVLDDGMPESLDNSISVEAARFGRMRGGSFDRALNLEQVKWEDIGTDAETIKYSVTPFANHILQADIHSDQDGMALLKVTSGNGTELQAGSGRSQMKHLNPYGESGRCEYVLVSLSKGLNQVSMRSFNHFERKSVSGLSVAPEQKIYRKKVVIDPKISVSEPTLHVKVSAADLASPHTDCGLHNLRLIMK